MTGQVSPREISRMMFIIWRQSVERSHQVRWSSVQVQWWENVLCENFRKTIVTSCHYSDHLYQPSPPKWRAREGGWPPPSSENNQNHGAAPAAHRAGCYTTRSSSQSNLYTVRAQGINISFHVQTLLSLVCKQITDRPLSVARTNICILESQHVEQRPASQGGEDQRKPALFSWFCSPLK